MGDEAQHADDFDATFQSSLARLQVGIETACASEDDWAAKVLAGVRAALAFAAANPAAAEALTNEAMAGGREGFAQSDRMIENFAEELRPGRAAQPSGAYLPQITEKTMVGGLAMLIAQRLSLGRHADLPALAPGATQFVLTPSLGTPEARA